MDFIKVQGAWQVAQVAETEIFSKVSVNILTLYDLSLK